MKKWTIVVLMSSSLASAQTGPQVFSAVESRYAVLFEWTSATGQLTGSAQVVSVNPDVKGINLAVVNAALVGTVSGSAHAFTINRPLIAPGVTALSGTLNGNELLLRYPLSTGGFGTLTLEKTSLTEFTRAIELLKQSATRDTQQLQRQSAASREQEETESLNREVKYTLADGDRIAADITTTLGLLQESVAATSEAVQAAALAVQTAVDRKCESTAANNATDSVDAVRLAGESLASERSYLLGLTDALRKNLTNYNAALKTLQSRLSSTDYARLLQAGSGQVKAAQAAMDTAQPVLTSAAAQAMEAQKQVESLSRTLRC
jgi:hypothetical protein